MVLTRTSSTSVTSPKIGTVLEWEFVIKLPTVSGMDMTVEAFVADLDTGQSCQVTGLDLYSAVWCAIRVGIHDYR